MADEGQAQDAVTKEIPPKDLGEIVSGVETSLGYSVYRGIGVGGQISHYWKAAMGKKSISDGQELMILQEASSLVNGPRVSYEEINRRYKGVKVRHETAGSLEIKFHAGMDAYLTKLSEKATTSAALGYAKAQMRGQ